MPVSGFKRNENDIHMTQSLTTLFHAFGRHCIPAGTNIVKNTLLSDMTETTHHASDNSRKEY
jgi:hypothetical protein